TPPLWRIVLKAPEPAPAWRGGRLRVVAFETGPQMKPLATPWRALGSRNIQMGVSGFRSVEVQNSAPDRQTRPKAANQRGLMRSINLPTKGASAPESTAMGIMSNADCVGVSPRTTR